MIIRTMKNLKSLFQKSFYLAAIFSMCIAFDANALVEYDWPKDIPNECRNSTDIFVDFEEGENGTEIGSTIPGLVFSSTDGLIWKYADTRLLNLEGTDFLYNPFYFLNGNFMTWLGVLGDSGRITFTEGEASYFSLLAKANSEVGIEIEAYDSDNNLLATSGETGTTIYEFYLTRVTVAVETANIAYVVIHDTGDYWTVDDICTDAGNAYAEQIFPKTKKGKAGSLMSVKFSLRTAETVDPAQPFVYDKGLKVKIYKISGTDDILKQESAFGCRSTDYKINRNREMYLTKFQTDTAASGYLVEILRSSVLIGSFEFETVKKGKRIR